MGDIMRPLSFADLMRWILREYHQEGRIFGIDRDAFYRPDKETTVKTALGESLGTLIGPAAGPHSQMAPNIIVSYLCGARFMELKTVQKLDGETIREAVHKPCILSEDEGYNCEWSTELRVEEAYAEYLKAWFALHVLQKELELSAEPDFAFNMSVGYDLEGIKSPKIDTYIEDMKDASEHPLFKECKAWLRAHISEFAHFRKADIEAIPSRISGSITLSTLHGCPPAEIERIARYLLSEKKLNTFVKCNPTLLGYDYARATLNQLGYDYIAFDDHHFKEDMQYPDCVAMIRRLRELAAEKQLAFGLKLSNTFPVDVKRGELPSEEMYMSGRSLHVLTLQLALRLAREFEGKLPLSFAGGADAQNLRGLLSVGLAPVTVATTLLKPGGYKRFRQMAKISAGVQGDYAPIDLPGLEKLFAETLADKRYHKSAREKTGSRKTASPLPLYDCYQAPCEDGGCPIHQQIPEYLKLVSEGKNAEAMRVIVRDNTAPTITGRLCPQPCRHHCTRLDYEAPLEIRKMKLLASEAAEVELSQELKPSPLKSSAKVLVIGAGPAGLAAATYLRRNGVEVKLRDKAEQAYGLVSAVIPSFRISDQEIERDLNLAKAYGVQPELAADSHIDLEEEKKRYAYIVLALGAHEPGRSPVESGSDKVTDALELLSRAKKNGRSGLSGRVAVVGGGDVAMDCARLLQRDKEVNEVVLVYRRGLADMPAAQEDVDEVLSEGISVRPFLQPICFDGHTLKVEKTAYSGWDANGRRAVAGSGEFAELPFDALVAATGARLNPEQYSRLGLNVDERGRARLNAAFESSVDGVYVIGDGRRGPATIVQAMADAKIAAADILRKEGLKADFVRADLFCSEADEYAAEAAGGRERSLCACEVAEGEYAARRGVLKMPLASAEEGKRCLSCDLLCEMCAEVCPNRANVALPLAGMKNLRQIVHIDRLCNECGNCSFFCPHEGRPYRDKWTLFSTEADFMASDNSGWLSLGGNKWLRRDEQGSTQTCQTGELPERERGLLEALDRCGMLTVAREENYAAD